MEDEGMPLSRFEGEMRAHLYDRLKQVLGDTVDTMERGGVRSRVACAIIGDTLLLMIAEILAIDFGYDEERMIKKLLEVIHKKRQKYKEMDRQ